MSDILLKITGLFPNQRKNNIRWLASLPEKNIAEILLKSIDKYNTLKKTYKDYPQHLRLLSAIILSTREQGWDTITGKGYRIAGKEQYHDWSNMRQNKIINLARDRPSPKKRQLLAHWGEVVELRKGQIGFRRISRYLKIYKKINVSPSYIHMLWGQIERGE